MAERDESASFGDLLRDHRRAAGLTQEELAERAGVSPRSISELERGGAHIPRRDTVGLLARALSLSGAARETFEGLVEQRRRARPARTPGDRTPMPAPTSTLAAGGAGTLHERDNHNLPRVLTSFVGREQELDELAPILPETPLLTLVGAGGVGKTRLAYELVRRQAAGYADGCWLVELNALADPVLVSDAVAAALGWRDVCTRDMAATLAEFIGDRHLLLVLDNCEHLIQACAQLVSGLLRACPRLHVLATSREPMAIAGELTWRVQPLDVPDPRQPVSTADLSRSAAACLFLERARAVNSSLMLTPHNAAAIARICVGVDGIPLALELAAARARLLTLDELAERLERDGGVLGESSRDRSAQPRTMRATLDWSHALLTEQEQILLRRLSVFAGGWTLDMAEEVCSGSGIERGHVLGLLGQLVDKSMAQVDSNTRVGRYRLLEPIRQYALERLQASGEASAFRDQHATAVLTLLLRGEPGGAGEHEVSSLDSLEREQDNVRAALGWTLANGREGFALRCTAGLFRFWERRGHFQEGCGWLEAALAAAPSAPGRDRGWALNALAFLYWRGGDYERAAPIADEALALSLDSGMPRDVAQALLNLGMIAYFRDEVELAVARLEESLMFARQAGYPSQLSVTLTFLARTLLWANGPRDRRVAAVLDESLGLARSANSRYAMGHALITRGDLDWRQGDVTRAIPYWQRALLVRWQLADRRGIAGALERLAWGMAAGDRFQAAAWLFGAAAAQHRALGIVLRHDEEIDHEHLLALTRQHLGAAFAWAWTDGQTATLDEAVASAMECARSQPDALQDMASVPA